MKAYKSWYENWWKEDGWGSNKESFLCAKDGWRAALKWAKSRSECSKGLYMISVNDIDKELEE